MRRCTRALLRAPSLMFVWLNGLRLRLLPFMAGRPSRCGTLSHPPVLLARDVRELPDQRGERPKLRPCGSIHALAWMYFGDRASAATLCGILLVAWVFWTFGGGVTALVAILALMWRLGI